MKLCYILLLCLILSHAKSIAGMGKFGKMLQKAMTMRRKGRGKDVSNKKDHLETGPILTSIVSPHLNIGKKDTNKLKSKKKSASAELHPRTNEGPVLPEVTVETANETYSDPPVSVAVAKKQSSVTGAQQMAMSIGTMLLSRWIFKIDFKNNPKYVNRGRLLFCSYIVLSQVSLLSTSMIVLLDCQL
jgi:hypothetical protein